MLFRSLSGAATLACSCALEIRGDAVAGAAAGVGLIFLCLVSGVVTSPVGALTRLICLIELPGGIFPLQAVTLTFHFLTCTVYMHNQLG